MTPLPRRSMVARLAVAVSIVLMAGSLTGASFGSRLAPTGVCGGGDTVVVINQMLQTRRPSRISVTKSVSLKANTKYSVTLHSWDDHPDREPQSNERWHIQLLSNGKTVYTSSDTPDISNTAETAKWNGTATFSGAPDTLVAIHPGGTPSGEDGDSVWAVCAVFNEVGNARPVIELLGKNPLSVPLGGTYDEPGWIATDAEDPNDTLTVDVGGDKVDPLKLGTYRLTYNVADSKKLPAIEKTRTVNVVKPPPQPPVMKLLGRNPDTVRVCTIYRDPGATATDVPDGDISHRITRENRVNSLKVGSYTVTYKVTDSAKNTVTKTRTVNVIPDDERGARPVITLIGPERITLAVNSPYRDLGATALDGGTVIPVETAGLPIVISKFGIHTVTYHAQDCAGNEATKTRTVIVGHIDLRPEISLIGDNVVEVEQGEPYEDEGATAWDVPDRDITASIEEHNPVDWETLGTYVVTYNVEDSTEQKADERTRIVRVVDDPGPVDLRPEITLIGDNLVEVEQISSYIELGATATDEEDGDLTDEIVTAGPIETAEPGTYTVTYDVEDSHEQSADQRTRTVRVIADGQAGDETTEEGLAEEPDGREEEVPESDEEDVQTRTDLVIALTDNEGAEYAGEAACPLSADGDIEYTVWFANFGTDDITVTARLETPRDVKPVAFDGGRCEASTCTTERVIPSGGELVCWTVGVVDESETMQEVVATVTVEGDGIVLLSDQEPTLLGGNR